ncbi:glycoside hydrolase family 127 protein [Flavicella marina]|uniref:glycoside hydrolase family 127 protein n=1 Tax=Flavicella marina TaxID=1475951 RepID=UPI0012656604|nr:beta-L-arabinofuranosidase domain-containing protein [Flavicella marina]
MKYSVKVQLILLLAVAMSTLVANGQTKGIINNKESKFVKLKSINIGDCQWTEGFWADKFKVAEEVMVPHMGTLLTGDVGHALNNFKIAAGLKDGKHKGMHWHDGDFYKWMEASMYIYAQNKDKKILDEIDGYIDIIGKAQLENGYLQTAITLNNRKPFSEIRFHEMYNSGHLYISACIHHRITGDDKFLNIAIKHANNLYKTFQPQPKELSRFGFNQVQIMGLVELYRTTKDNRYLELAEIFINMRGKSKVVDDPSVRVKMMGDMTQERVPIRKETEAVGHAVLALYFYAGAADVAAETGEQALIDALDRLWENVTDKKMYVTGAVGQTHHGSSSRVDMVHEAFINEYMMPNSTAYNETCANLCNAMFSYRMLSLKGESKHADIVEKVLFNSGLSGISIEGKDYFYANPLRVNLNTRKQKKDRTETEVRQPYISCFCCPPNLVRTIAKTSGWAYSLAPNGIAVNLYGGNVLNTNLLDGSKISLEQETKYPWEGKVKITLKKAKRSAFEILLRIPSWADGTQIFVNSEKINTSVVPGEFASVSRKWKKGDVITIDMPMEVKYVQGHPRIEEVRNQVAVQRGPVVYCVETADLPEDTKILDVYLPSTSELNAVYKPDFLGGLTTIDADVLLRKDKSSKMYRSVDKPTWEKVSTQFVPYYAWSNRGKSEMSVWVPIIWE